MSSKYKIIAESLFYRILSNIHPYSANIIVLSMDDLNKSDTYYDSIYKLKTDGIVIRKFAAAEEIARFKKKLSAYRPEITYTTDFGYTIGQTLSNSTPENYFERSAAFRHDLKELISFDFTERFETVLNKIGGNAKAKIPQMEDGQTFCPATFRIMNPFKGAIKIHAEKMINCIRPINNELLSRVNLGQQELSFFLTLQNSEKGGDLILFDKKYSHSEYDISKGLPAVKDIIGSRVKILRIEEGDLILFNGGEIWHRIDDIRGKTNRITLAGFSDYSKQSDTIHYWS